MRSGPNSLHLTHVCILLHSPPSCEVLRSKQTLPDCQLHPQGPIPCNAAADSMQTAGRAFLSCHQFMRLRATAVAALTASRLGGPNHRVLRPAGYRHLAVVHVEVNHCLHRYAIHAFKTCGQVHCLVQRRETYPCQHSPKAVQVLTHQTVCGQTHYTSESS